MNEKFKQQVIEQTLEYSAKYKCSLRDALWDWEGNGPEGSFGLQHHEMSTLTTALKDAGHDLDAEVRS